MSWVVEEWKEGLSTKVLQKIQELESQLEKLRKERQQRQFQLESLEAALQKQKQKVDHEKNEGATLKREKQNLMELCDTLENASKKLSHELQVKEAQVNFQEGQLVSSKKQIERLEQELKRYKSEEERSQKTLAAGDASFNSTPQKNIAAPSTPSCNDSKFEELKVKYSKEVEERKRLEAEMKSLKSQKTSTMHAESAMSRREIARQQSSSSVFSWQQEKTPKHHSFNSQEMSMSCGLVTSHLSQESEATPSQKDERRAKKEFTPCSTLDNCKDSSIVDQMKIQNQELRSRIKELENKLQIEAEDTKFSLTKIQETQMQLEYLKIELSGKDKELHKTKNEMNKIIVQLDQVTAQCAAKEEKVKKLADELNCQRQSYQNAQLVLQEKLKEKEKECQQEFSLQLSQVKTQLQEELHQAKNSYNLLQAQLDKALSAKQQFEKNASDLTQKLSQVGQTIQTMQWKENELKNTNEETKKQISFLNWQSGQQLQEICQLKNELCIIKQRLQQSQNCAEDLKNKNCSLERESKLLGEKLNKQADPLTLEKMKLELSDMENERESLQQLLKQKDNMIEELNIKLEDFGKLQNILAECEGLKKEIESLSQWKKESEQLLNKLGLEKEELMSQVSSLESALVDEQLRSHERVRVLEGENENLNVEVKHLQRTMEYKTAELEDQRKVCYYLQQNNSVCNEKYREETEKNLLKLAEVTQHVIVLQKQLQSAADEVLAKGRCIASLETSLASHAHLNEQFQKQSEELAQARHAVERQLAEAEQRHEDFAWETRHQINELQAAMFEKQDMLSKTLAVLAEKDEKLQALMKQLGKQHAENHALCEDSTQRQQLIDGAQAAGQNSSLNSSISSLEQKTLDLMQNTLSFSSSLKEREEFSELSERHRENVLLFLETARELEKKSTSLEAKNENLECVLKEHACHSEMEKAKFETPDRQLMSKYEELQSNIVPLEEKVDVIPYKLAKTPSVSEKDRLLSQEKPACNKMQHHDYVLVQEDLRPVKEMKIGNEDSVSDFTLARVFLEQLQVSVKEKEDELNKYQVKLEMLQMDLEDKESSVENYCEQIKQLKTALETMEVKLEENEMEKERLKGELQTLKDLEGSDLDMTSDNGKDQLSVYFNIFTKDILKQQVDAKHDLTPIQNDYVQLVSSLHVTLSKLTELLEMCKHLQVKSSALASWLKDSQSEDVKSADAVMQELVDKMNNLKEERVTFPDEVINQNRTGVSSAIERTISLECCDGLNDEDLKLSNEEIKVHFDKVKEKVFTLRNEYEIFQGQNLKMDSKILELLWYVERLKGDNTGLTTNFNKVEMISLRSEVIPVLVDQKCQSEETYCIGFPYCGETSNCAKAIPSDSIKSDGINHNKQPNLEDAINQHSHYFVDPHYYLANVSSIKKKQVVTEKYDLKKAVEHLLHETYGKSSKMLEESFMSHKNLEDEEIKKIQEILFHARKEIDGLQKQTVSDNQQWQQKLNNILLQVGFNLKAEKNPLELLPQKQVVPLPVLDLSSRALLSLKTEQQVQIEQVKDPLWQLEIRDLCNESMVVETLNDKMMTRNYQVNRTDDKTAVCETELSVKSPEKLILDIKSRNVPDECMFPTKYQEELIFPSDLRTSTMSECFVENSETTSMSHLQIKQASHQQSKSFRYVEECSKKTDTLLIEIQYLKSDLESKDKELAEKRITCVELDKTITVLEEEKTDLSDALKSVTFDNQQLSYNLMTLGMELNKVKSDLEMYRLRLSDTTEELEDLEMAKADWMERLLETENELRRIKSEKANVENHALSMEAAIEELHLKNEQLEKKNENNLKTIFSLQEQLQIITTERNQFTEDLKALSKDKKVLDEMCQKMQKTIKELESSHVNSAEYIWILEAEAKTRTNLLQDAKAESDQLLAEKDHLVGQLENLDKLVRDLVLEKEAAQSQMEHLRVEKEANLREYETLHDRLSNSEMENRKISKSLEGSLIEKGELAARLNSAQEEVVQLRQGIEKLKTKVESDEKHKCRLAEKLRESRQKVDGLVDRIQNLQREVEVMEENLEDAILQSEMAKEETERATSEMDRMRVGLQSVECERDALKSTKQCLERELKGEQDKVASLEGSHSKLVKQLEEKERECIEHRGQYENTMEAMKSQLNQVHEETKQSLNKQNICKDTEQDLMNKTDSFKHGNTHLDSKLEEEKDKYFEAEQLVESLIQEFQVFIQKSDVLLEHLPKGETSLSLCEEPYVPFKHLEELEATTSRKCAYLEKALQLRKEYHAFYCEYRQWLKTFGELKQENKQMRKQIHELQCQRTMVETGSEKDAASEDMEELRESAEERTIEADDTLEKYCSLLINHHKLEEENEMLRIQVSLLKARLKQSSDPSSSYFQSPTKITSCVPIGKLSPEDVIVITEKWQQCPENGSHDEKSRSLQETVTVMRTVFQQHGSSGPEDSTKDETGVSPEIKKNGSSSPCDSHLTLSKRSCCLVNPSVSSPLFSAKNDDMLENPEATAEGSRIQKMNKTVTQEMQMSDSALAFTHRSPLSSCNQSLLPEVGRSAECLNTITAGQSQSSEKSELDKACHVQ